MAAKTKSFLFAIYRAMPFFQALRDAAADASDDDICEIMLDYQTRGLAFLRQEGTGPGAVFVYGLTDFGKYEAARLAQQETPR